MQNKGAVRLFTIVFALTCIYMLSFTWVSRSVENDAKEYANGDPNAEQRYLDSISGEGVFDVLIRDYTYAEVKAQEINLGLDLKGGMNVILEVSVKDIIFALANESKDPIFNQALDAASKRQKDSQADYLTLFAEEFQRINSESSEPTTLSSPYIFGNKDLLDDIGVGATDEEVIAVVREEANSAVDKVFTVLKARIDKFGVVQPNVQRLEGTGRILVELPGIKDPERAIKLLQQTAKLEFWEAYEVIEVIQFLDDANTKLRDLVEKPARFKEIDSLANVNDSASENEVDDLESLFDNDIAEDSTGTDSTGAIVDLDEPVLDSAAQAVADSTRRDSIARNTFNPLFQIFGVNIDQSNPQTYFSPYIGRALITDTAKINEYLNMPEIRRLLPNELRYVKFRWHKPDVSDRALSLIALKGNREDKPELEGDVIVRARQDFEPETGRPIVAMDMNQNGANQWQKFTAEVAAKERPGAPAEYANGGYIAIVLDDVVYSVPRNEKEIPGGSTRITMGSTNRAQGINEAKDLANVLEAGKLPAPARIIQADVVGPSLGQEAINAGVTSFIIALVIVLLYMIFYYSFAGIVSNIALVANMLFMFGVLASLGSTLTLPGIAGIVLTIGMAVDANVLIYERIREELRNGKGVGLAIKDGYVNAYSSIIDANVTTFLTGVILLSFGSGPIKGFATTLVIGILTSLFSAIFITRLVFEWRLAKKKEIKFSTKLTENAFTNTKFKFIGSRKIAYIISGLIIAIGIFSLTTKGLKLGVDFEGGRSYTVRFAEEIDIEEIRTSLSDVFIDEEGNSSSLEVKAFGGTGKNQVKITTNFMINSESKTADETVQRALFDGISSYFADGTAYEDFVADDEAKQEGIMQSIKVGPTIADDIQKDAFKSFLFALIGIFLYILFRFSKWQFSLGAVAAVFHDVLIVLSLFSIFYGILPFSLEIDQAFIAAILTVVGYSLNDTVVVFDRIREYLRGNKKQDMDSLVNDALNSTLSRTVNTSITTFFVLLIIFIFGGEVIRGFMFALMIGVVVGTYSSLFIATPVMLDTMKKTDRERISTTKKKK